MVIPHIKSSGKLAEKETDQQESSQEEIKVQDLEEQIQSMQQEMKIFQEIESLEKPAVFRYNLILNLQKMNSNQEKINENLRNIGLTLTEIGKLFEEQGEK